MSSELSNALNPNVVTTRRPRPTPNGAENAAPVVEQPLPPPRPFVPHRSELELAISEPPPRSVAVPARNSGASTSRQATAVQELLRVLSSSKEAAELERKRRQAWEEEQEARFIQRQAEMERQMLEMRQELSQLKSHTLVQSPGPSPVGASPTTANSVPIGDGNTVSPVPVLAPAFYSASLPHASPMAQTTVSPAGLPSIHHLPTLLTPPAESPHVVAPAMHAQAIPRSEANSTASSPRPDLRSPSLSNALITPEHTPRLLAVQPRPLSASAASRHTPAFVEGSSSQPYDTPSYSPITTFIDGGNAGYASPAPAHDSLSPPLERRESVTSPSSALGKRRTLHYSSSEDSDDSADEDARGSSSGQPRKRVNGHDKRCLTIQHAMRAHILRLMQVPDDKNLPDSHVEGEPLSTDEPVRFIWEKTSKQSSHNAAMKRRIIVDLQAKRAKYKRVPEKEFSRKSLESVFDQAFTTMRQKFRAQRDTTAALQLKRREDQKSLKARRSGRKKLKLANRVGSRKRLEVFSHPAFDGALQQDCMSSEESCDDDDGLQTKHKVLRIRGLPWRSLRLQRFYALLDEEDQADKSSKPKRGIGRKERHVGPDKDPHILPPMGVSRWMISKRWIRHLQCTRADLAQAVMTVVSVSDGVDWNECAILGAESDDDADLQDVLRLDRHIPVSETSSLQHALTPSS
ncbi:uncharacterized protein B0H18DRAFT_966294 [Fomitopsis serialis]|uniref:uncharacterized protein n=1 Tax=Fomitopsis serialis TaxID=139415 RepID=UPI0020081F46|nr:uncharacterized protein B0H18DRAFT_966294 [Neoantrodia serialis]KAH9938263.1 hypothetical protein B0H18DRAFT_966294 [Neoantrodia serialis]